MVKETAPGPAQPVEDAPQPAPVRPNTNGTHEEFGEAMRQDHFRRLEEAKRGFVKE
jgi:hypothetical protein